MIHGADYNVCTSSGGCDLGAFGGVRIVTAAAQCISKEMCLFFIFRLINDRFLSWTTLDGALSSYIKDRFTKALFYAGIKPELPATEPLSRHQCDPTLHL